MEILKIQNVNPINLHSMKLWLQFSGHALSAFIAAWLNVLETGHIKPDTAINPKSIFQIKCYQNFLKLYPGE